MNISDCITSFYEGYNEEGRLTSRHGSVEFLTTMKYIRKYLTPGDRVLEIGAGTGRYSHAIARMGYDVDAIELVPHNVELFKLATQPGESVNIRQGNALDLTGIPTKTYDMTLLLGPMYHLFSQEEKLQALNEAIRVTKNEGFILVAYVITDGSLLDEGFCQRNVDVERYLAEGLLDPTTFKAASRPENVFELVRKEDIDALIAHVPVTRLHYVATDGCALILKEALDKMDERAFEVYMRYHLAICERNDMVGMTSHALDILFKEQQ